MTDVFVDATTLISLGSVGELDRLTCFSGTLVVVSLVRDEVSTEPARTNLTRFLERHDVQTDTNLGQGRVRQAMAVLGDDTETGDARPVAAVLDDTADDRPIGVVSDDRRVRTTCRGLGATVTGTLGVVVRAVENGLDPEAAKQLVSRLDSNGLHLTGSLRDEASTLIDAAAAKPREYPSNSTPE